MTSNGRNEEQVEEIFGQLVQVLLKFDQVQVQQWWGSERGSKKVQKHCPEKNLVLHISNWCSEAKSWPFLDIQT